MRTLACGLLVLLFVPFTGASGEENVVPQGKAVELTDLFVCRSLNDAKAVVDALATNDEEQFAKVAVPLQKEGRCGKSRGLVVYQATVYEREDTQFRVLSLRPVGSTTTYYEITNWRIRDDTI